MTRTQIRKGDLALMLPKITEKKREQDRKDKPKVCWCLTVINCLDDGSVVVIINAMMDAYDRLREKKTNDFLVISTVIETVSCSPYSIVYGRS